VRAIVIMSLLASGFVGGRATHDIGGFGAFLVSFFRAGASRAVMKALVATRPAVVTRVHAGVRAGG
jgi:hypothetical protein